MMKFQGNTWVIVLAAGDGRRLHRLTTDESGVAVPKQFCSLRGGTSLLREAMQRAEAIASAEHICTVVAGQHRQWWEPALQAIDPANIIVQPRNCGTAHGILLPLLHIIQRDPDARLVLLPSDHHVENERVLAAALKRAVRRLRSFSDQVLLLGIAPEAADPDLGYIVPGASVGAEVSTVARFVEKPTASLARQLIEGGALWNAFIVAACARTLLELFQARFPRMVEEMELAVDLDRSTPNAPIATTGLYQHLSDVDFSKHVLEGAEPALRVVPVPQCGWSDLGTPVRLAETLQRRPRGRDRKNRAYGGANTPCAGFLNLSLQHARLLAADAAAPE